MMEPGYEKPRNNKNQNDEDLLYEIEECNNTHPLDPKQFKMFRNELKLFTLKYICKKLELSDFLKKRFIPNYVTYVFIERNVQISL